jgi:hypothetical protein
MLTEPGPIAGITIAISALVAVAFICAASAYNRRVSGGQAAHIKGLRQQTSANACNTDISGVHQRETEVAHLVHDTPRASSMILDPSMHEIRKPAGTKRMSQVDDHGATVTTQTLSQWDTESLNAQMLPQQSTPQSDTDRMKPIEYTV